MNHTSQPRKVLGTEEIKLVNAKRIEELQKNHTECTGEPIVHFDGEYAFLSNFFDSPLFLNGYSFQNGEAAFQGFKDMNRTGEFATIKPGKAKQLGRQVKLRPDWEVVKTAIMEDVVRAKFTQNEELQEKLLATEDRLLIEGNWWKDKIWGVSNGRGENRLGIILMNVRKELKETDPIALYV